MAIAASRPPGPLPQQFSFDRREEGFDRRVVVAIPGTAHRHFGGVLAQDLLVIVRAVLAAAIRMMDAALGRSPQRNRHVQRPDREIALHPVAEGPSNTRRECRSRMTAR